jgi:glycosyltransferase involved in cell wall biosynthesis
MISEKPEIVFTFPACMGGVASFNYNIINYSKLIGSFYSRVILLQAEEDSRPRFTDKFIADEVTVFSFSYKENQYSVMKRLASLIGGREGALVTDNALTVNAAAVFESGKTVYHLLHDYYYVNQNIQLGDLVDVAIAHSSFFSDALFASSPHLFLGRSIYIPYGVKQCPGFPEKKSEGELNLVFLGRMDESKGATSLIAIENSLAGWGVDVSWTIIGKGPIKEVILGQWSGKANVTFHEPDSTDEVYELLAKQDILVFPTLFEGTPVSILESMANGVVVLVNDLPGGIRDLVDQRTGYRCRVGEIDDYVKMIVQYNSDRELLKQLQVAAFERANLEYDINIYADRYFEEFLRFRDHRRRVKNNRVVLSRLDKPFFPNSLVKFIRSIR